MRYIKHFFVYLLLLVALYSNAQQFSEGFNNNQNEWTETKTDERVVEIKNGKYSIEQFNATASFSYLKSFGLNTTKDFKIEYGFRILKGDLSSTVAFSLSYIDAYNNVLLKIDPSGKCRLSVNSGGQESLIFPVKTLKLCADTSINRVKIENKNEIITFYLNNKPFYFDRISNLNLIPNQLGFAVEGNIKLDIDFLNIEGELKSINLSKEHDISLIRENLGENINSIHTEVNPKISHDGKLLSVNRKDHPQNTGATVNDDIWFSARDKENWMPIKNGGFPLNNTGHNFIISISADNNVIYVNGTYSDQGGSLGDGISVSKRTANGGWSVPKKVFVYNNYNENQYTSSCMSQDNKTLIFSVQRKDGIGLLDLFVSFLKEDGTYTEPKLMGNVINTKADESTPFLAADNKTLYFGSNGHLGYGSYDIFVSRRLDESWTNWSEPENLGPQINTDGWDAYFSIPANGEYAYMVSDKNSIGQEDVIRLKVPEKLKPNPIVLIKGKTLSKKNNAPLGTTIKYLDIDDEKNVSYGMSDPSNGNYNIILQYGRKYAFRAELEGYYAINDYIDLTTIDKYQEIELDLYLQPIEVGEIIRLNNIFFDTDKSDLKPESTEELGRLLLLLKQNTFLEIDIMGHTDDQGNNDYNLKLSQNRCESVMKYLIQNGISAQRLKAIGYGETNPIVENSSEKNRGLNRRVEFIIRKK